MKSYVISENDSGQRLNRFIEKIAPNLPKSICYKAIRKKNIKINKKRCEAKDILATGDVVDIYLSDDFFIKKTKDASVSISKGKLNIVYEDINIIVINKPIGLKSQPDILGEDSLVGRLINYMIETKKYDFENENTFKPALCNRLDTNTNGLVIAAKNAAVLRDINKLIRDGNIEKKYSCVVQGRPSKYSDILTGWWSKDGKSNKVRITPFKRDNAKKVITEYKVIEEFKEKSKLEVILHTGRSHQIRAHFASIGHPIVGDIKYGSKFKGTQKLTACEIIFHSKNSILDYLDDKSISL